MKKEKIKEAPINFNFIPENYPALPGCYLMKDKKGRVIYVGKAKELRRRLSYYFRSRRQYYKTRRMVPRIYDIEIIIVNNETESLILENNLIKFHKPGYNSMLKQDDVGYPFIVLTGEKFPRLLPYRKNWSNRQYEETEGKEEGRRFGPYLNKEYRDAVMDLAIETFGLRICRHLPKKSCFRYRLKKCSGICEGHISPDAYMDNVRQATALLEYRYTEIINMLKSRMDACAGVLDFELAAKLRDRIEAIENFLEKQIVERDEKYDQDILYFGYSHVMVMELKKGVLLKAGFYSFENEAEFLHSRYMEHAPEEIIVNRQMDAGDLEKHLFSKNKTPVRITIPEKGIKSDLLLLCKKNYEYHKSKAQGSGCKVQRASAVAKAMAGQEVPG
ncbi:MAG: GIY-YIG nuclease family protein [Deltaproteobacteria bacterium]|nr:GIY-YIG nuclease family protein [Deltaproteobacteria bacterium]